MAVDGLSFAQPALTGIQDEFNRKGLISEQGQKKMAFYVLQKAYREQSVGKPR